LDLTGSQNILSSQMISKLTFNENKDSVEMSLQTYSLSYCNQFSCEEIYSNSHVIVFILAIYTLS